MMSVAAWGRSAVVLAGLLAGPVSAMTIMQVDYVCPIGGERFSAETMGSGTAFGHFLDGRLEGAIQSPWPLVQCPGNGLVLFKQHFSTDELKRLTPFVESDEYQQLRTSETSYWLLWRLLEVLDAPLEERAGVLQRATWQASPAQYRRYVEVASAAFGQQCPDAAIAIERGEGWLYCQLLLGEWERRLARFDQARARFQRLQPLAEELVPGEDRRRALAQYQVEIRQQLALIADRIEGPVRAEDASTPQVDTRPLDAAATLQAATLAAAAAAADAAAGRQQTGP